MDQIIVQNGDRKAVFNLTEDGWTPDWFYCGDRPMLRFKDHEWLSVGHVHPDAAETAEKTPDGGATFKGLCKYGETDVPWQVIVRPDDRSGGFIVECSFTPAETLELMEAYSTFETPYEYDGSETVTTVIGQNPIEKWAGDKRVTPPQWRHAVWQYSRPEAVRMTGPCNIPYLCQAIEAGGKSRFTTVIGDWNVCKVRDVYVTPTRTIARYQDDWSENKSDQYRGYKFIVGALNWSSAFAKDPNVIYKGAHHHSQRLVINFDETFPGGTLDSMLYQAWERVAALDLPEDGTVEAWERAAKQDVTWQTAVRWLRDVFCSDGIEGLYLKDRGILTYAAGTRPKVGGDYSYSWWPQWSGGFHYQALLRNDQELERTCQNLDEKTLDTFKDGKRGRVSLVTLPSLWWVTRSGGTDGPLAEIVGKMVQSTYEHSVAENGKERTMDYGNQSTDAEGLLLFADAFGNEDYKKQALLLLEEINEQLDGAFWWFGNTTRESMFHGGQVRPMGHSHAVLANWLAYKATADQKYLTAARRFARYMLAINYVTHNASQDPDFDWRAWANGTIAGRDQYAEFPPWETSNPFTCLAWMMDEVELEPGFYDLLWYFARTGLAQFPAAREFKRILDESMAVRFVPRKQIASERDFYDILPYLAYENPHDQTLLASYQGTDCLLIELMLGNGLATAADRRLGVFVPAAATMAPDLSTKRSVHVWNPTAAEIASAVAVTWPDGSQATQQVTAPPRQVVKLSFEK